MKLKSNLLSDLNRKKYINIMKTTDYGWSSDSICCPSDTKMVTADEEVGKCQSDYEECVRCWETVLKTKKDW